MSPMTPDADKADTASDEDDHDDDDDDKEAENLYQSPPAVDKLKITPPANMLYMVSILSRCLSVVIYIILAKGENVINTTISLFPKCT